jgi:hypothetical protein
MGSFSFSSASAAVVPPCHQMVMEQETPVSEKNCLACDVSEEGWDQQFVNPLFLNVHKVCEAPVVLESWLPLFPEMGKSVEVLSVPDPPDEVSVLHAELVVKNSTIFVI